MIQKGHQVLSEQILFQYYIDFGMPWVSILFGGNKAMIIS